jgi:hypothetical protein
MTQEQKELLLKDLCARLPYGVICNYNEHSTIKERLVFSAIARFIDDTICVRPYLFPLSSMTEEQRNELHSLMIRDSYGILYHTIESFDYCYKNNIDIRGLIPMGLANDATNKNIY